MAERQLCETFFQKKLTVKSINLISEQHNRKFVNFNKIYLTQKPWHLCWLPLLCKLQMNHSCQATGVRAHKMGGNTEFALWVSLHIPIGFVALSWRFHMLPLVLEARQTVWTKAEVGKGSGKPKYYCSEIQYGVSCIIANKLAPNLAVHHPPSRSV